MAASCSWRSPRDPFGELVGLGIRMPRMDMERSTMWSLSAM